MKKKEKKYPFSIGDILVKNNYTPFGHDQSFVTITVESLEFLCKYWRVNGLYYVTPKTVTKITEEEQIFINSEWDSIGISDYNGSENNPCTRSDNGLPKQSIPESNIKNLVYNYRHKYNNPAFEVYRCPKCNNLHLGKNSFIETI